jgi:coenzyme F420 hydrogenase subunit beta
MESKSCQELESEVINRELCTLCGACVGMCPYILAYRGRVLVRDVCDLSAGRCSTYCPRISLDVNELSRTVFDAPYDWNGMGTVLGIFMARPTDGKARARAQDAGTVSTFARFALEQGIIDSAVVTFFDDKAFPQARAVSDGEELVQSAGSSYMATPVLEAFNRAVKEPDRKRIGVVATPCQAMALARMKGLKPEEGSGIDKLELVIGLFCTWALSYPAFAEFLEKEVPDPIVKYKIPPPPAQVLQTFTSQGETDLPLDRIMPFIRPACRFCHDMTSEFADISVGAVEFTDVQVGDHAKKGSPWNTVIVRTERGMRLLDSARDKGIIETAQLPSNILDHLKNAARNKKRRALQNIVQRTGSREDLLYFKIEPSTIGMLLDE